MLKQHPLGLVTKNALISSIMDASTSVSALPPTLNGPDFWACSESFNCAAAEDIGRNHPDFNRSRILGALLVLMLSATSSSKCSSLGSVVSNR